jgi:hypothetical protein
VKIFSFARLEMWSEERFVTPMEQISDFSKEGVSGEIGKEKESSL